MCDQGVFAEELVADDLTDKSAAIAESASDRAKMAGRIRRKQQVREISRSFLFGTVNASIPFIETKLAAFSRRLATCGGKARTEEENPPSSEHYDEASEDENESKLARSASRRGYFRSG